MTPISQELEPPANPGRFSRDAWSSNGLFAQARLGYRDALYLTAGARSDEHSYFGDDYGRAWAPSVGTAYTLTLGRVQTKWRLEWGRGIRAPYPWAKITQNYGTLIFLGNPEIGPERQSGWDGGVDLYFGDRFKMEVTRYDQMVDNSIDMVNLEPINGVGVTQYQNVGKISNKGWELQANLDLSPFKFIGTVSTMESRVEALSPSYLGMYKVGDKMQQVPDVTANMTLTYLFRDGSASIDVTHIGERVNFDGLAYCDDMYGGGQMKNYFDYFVPHDPITKLDLRLERSFKRRLTVFFWTRNLFDNQQGELASGYASLGRTLGLGLRVRS